MLGLGERASVLRKGVKGLGVGRSGPAPLPREPAPMEFRDPRDSPERPTGVRPQARKRTVKLKLYS